MAAGLGFKDFTTGEVLTAADVDGYLMQGIWVFASAAARDAAVTSPQEGNFAFLKDTNTTTYYTGSAWTNLDTTGMVNPMTTTGDMVYSSSGSTPARIGIGTAGQVLQVNSGATAPEWATASSGGMTLLNSGGTTLSGSSVTISSIAGTYKNLLIMIRSPKPSSAGSTRLRFNSDTGSNYNYLNANVSEGLAASVDAAQISWYQVDTGTATGLITAIIYDYANTSTRKVISAASIENSQVSATTFNLARNQAFWNNNDAITSVTVLPSAGTWTSGTLFIYGVS